MDLIIYNKFFLIGCSFIMEIIDLIPSWCNFYGLLLNVLCSFILMHHLYL